jgi:hypothetical protein
VNLKPFTCTAIATVAAAVTLALTACTGSPAASGAASTGISPAPGPYARNPDSGDCLLGANGADVEAGIANPTVSCSRWIQNLAGIGLVWYPISQMAVPGSPGSADQETMEQACDLTDGTQELYVEDAGGQMYGDSICSQEEQNGWTPEASPGPLAAQAQQEARQQAQQQASASAAARAQQEQAALSHDDQALDSDVSALDNDLSTWSSDVATASSDYKSLLSEPVCQPDGSSDQNTYDDAQNVYDDGQGVYDDESALSNDISSVQNAMSAVNSDLAQIGGTQGGTTYANDLAAAQAAVSKARAAVRADDSSKIQSEAEAVQAKVNDCTG